MPVRQQSRMAISMFGTAHLRRATASLARQADRRWITWPEWKGCTLVYTAKSFAAVLAHVESGDIPKGARVCFIHTGGLAALFAYQDVLSGLDNNSGL